MQGVDRAVGHAKPVAWFAITLPRDWRTMCNRLGGLSVSPIKHQVIATLRHPLLCTKFVAPIGRSEPRPTDLRLPSFLLFVCARINPQL
jgi:hypothetical protein